MFSSPTIKDIAREAGLHFTTVSMALRGHPHISAETRERVRALAERMGYRRNPVYAALTQHRSGTRMRERPPKIAFIANRAPEEGFYRASHRRQFIAGVKEQAAALGYDSEVLFLAKGYHTSASLYDYLKKQQVSGLVLGAFEPHLPSLILDWSEFCVVKIDSRHMAPAATFVSNDQLGAVRTAFTHLRGLGYKRIGIAVGAIDEEGTDHLYLSGYYLEQAQIPAAERVLPLVFPMGMVETARIVPLMGQWVREQRVEAVMCNWTSVRSMLRSSGLRSPEDVASCCLCLTSAVSGLAGVRVDGTLVGRRAVSLLIDLLRADRRGVPDCPTNTYIGCSWQDGVSAPAVAPVAVS
jgi:LacI family transcriptional regulator